MSIIKSYSMDGKRTPHGAGAQDVTNVSLDEEKIGQGKANRYDFSGPRGILIGPPPHGKL
jgi:hypothetical protein